MPGASMYRHLQKYLLSEEELSIHGFPRPPPEGSKPGRASILSEAEAKRTALRESLPHNQVQSTPTLTDFKGPTIFISFRRIYVIASLENEKKKIPMDSRIASFIGGFSLLAGSL